MSNYSGKDQTRVAAGLKAIVHNPNVSSEAKESATEKLHEMGVDLNKSSTLRTSGGNGGKRRDTQALDEYANDDGPIAGRTRLNGPDLTNVSIEDVQLDDDDNRSGNRSNSGTTTASGNIDGKDSGNVLRGYKAALNNPRVSDEAKEQAEQVLRDHDAI